MEVLSMKLIVGLGNPGNEYQNTRHNMGFMVIDKILNELNLNFTKNKHKGVYVQTKIKGEDVIILKPLTYMNLSGESIKEVMSYYKITPNDILVIYDDMDTNVGGIRLRLSGSAGGHNGMKSIIKLLGTESFKRIRVGVGKDPNIDIINYVLGKPKKEDLPKIEEALTKAMKASIDFVSLPFDKVMSMYNTKG